MLVAINWLYHFAPRGVMAKTWLYCKWSYDGQEKNGHTMYHNSRTYIKGWPYVQWRIESNVVKNWPYDFPPEVMTTARPFLSWSYDG